jgi:hypothetical protein
MSNLPAVAARYELNQIKDMAGAIAQSGLFGIKTQEQAYALMLIADAEGLHPATAAQDYDVIQGRPARKTHSVLARFQQAGGSVEWQELSEIRAAAKFTHPRGGSVVIEWTIDMAARARLVTKDNWKMYPRAMLRARCIGEGVRAVYPAAIGGSLLAEEAQDLDAVDIIDSNAAPAPAAPTFKVTRKPKAEQKPVPTDDDVTDVESKPVDETPSAPVQPASADDPIIGANEAAYMRKKIETSGADAAKLLKSVNAASVESLTKSQFAALKNQLLGQV